MTLTAVLTELGGAIADLFVSIVGKMSEIFFSVGSAGAISVTPIGYLALISLVLTIVYFVFRWVSGLIKGRK